MGHLHKGGVLAAVLLSATAGQVAAADRIALKDGSVVFGTVTDADGGVVKVETDFAGTLAIEQEQIASLRTEAPFTLQLDDGTVIESRPLAVENSQLVDLGTGASYAIDDLTRVNPEPWELGNGYHWTGLASAGLSIEQGNTDTRELDYKIESIWTSLLDRITLRLIGEYDEANSEKNAENWIFTSKYDRFVEDEDWYWGAHAIFEHDEFADTDLRTTVGPYLGNRFFTDPVFTMEAEVGFAYVWEEFIVAEDQEYAAMTWHLNMSSNWLGDGTRLYFQQTGTWDLEQTSDVLINSTAGLSVPLLLNIEGAAEVILKYDSGAVDNVESLDQTYRFRLGYSW
jgi:putative salt-induced outer membrane protein YdiY